MEKMKILVMKEIEVKGIGDRWCIRMAQKRVFNKHQSLSMILRISHLGDVNHSIEGDISPQ